jgi:hypothetical protein
MRQMAEREGFEPSNEVNPRYAISSRARSTAPAPLRVMRCARRPTRTQLLPGRGSRLAAASTGYTSPMLLLANVAVTKDIGLLATFLGIGVIVNVIVVYIAIQIHGERQQNRMRRDGLRN